MNNYSLEFFKLFLEKNVNVESNSINSTTSLTTKLYKSLIYAGDNLTVVLNTGEILMKSDATSKDFLDVKNAKTLIQIVSIFTNKLNFNNVDEGDLEVEKRNYERESNRKEGIKLLLNNPDFTKLDSSIYYKSIDRSMPALLVDEFIHIMFKHGVDNYTKTDEYIGLVRFWMWSCLNPREEVANHLFEFLKNNAFRITKQGFFVALRNVVTLHGSTKLIDSISNYYHKVKGVWKKNPNDYFVFLKDDEYKLVHKNSLYKEETYTSTKCEECDGVGGFYENHWDDEFSDECDNCNGIGEVESYSYTKTVKVDHGELIGNLTELYLDLPNRSENRFTDNHTKTFDIRIGKIVSMPLEKCTWNTQDCGASGLHFTSNSINYVGCGDKSILMLINPMKVVGIGTSKGRCYEYLPIMTVDSSEVTKILHDLDFNTIDLDDSYAVSELDNLETKVLENYSIESEKHEFNIPLVNKHVINEIVTDLNDIKKIITKRVVNLN